MPDPLWRPDELMPLREMLRRLLEEESRTRRVDAENASHLAQAVVDLKTLIARAESGSRGSSLLATRIGAR